MSAHTPEPWALAVPRAGCHNPDFAIPIGPRIVYDDHSPGIHIDDMRRLAACVNACAGMADPAAEITALKQVGQALHDELNAVLSAIGHDNLSDDNGTVLAVSVIRKWKQERGDMLAALKAAESILGTEAAIIIPAEELDVVINKIRHAIASAEEAPWFPQVSAEGSES
jgi:hypothetical protein